MDWNVAIGSYDSLTAVLPGHRFNVGHDMTVKESVAIGQSKTTEDD